jgi:hypothetical protein
LRKKISEEARWKKEEQRRIRGYKFRATANIPKERDGAYRKSKTLNH